jgi:hypothetical protein
MVRTANIVCNKCGATIPLGADCYEDGGVLRVRYDPARIKKIIMIDSDSGSERTIESLNKQPSARQIAGIIGPY